ncbi:MAG: hypothetical protein F9B45_02940 [Phycisphaera sp. RhM]|nr:hypothetical protein [Phycisphaera sp. RhM]
MIQFESFGEGESGEIGKTRRWKYYSTRPDHCSTELGFIAYAEAADRLIATFSWWQNKSNLPSLSACDVILGELAWSVLTFADFGDAFTAFRIFPHIRVSRAAHRPLRSPKP